MKLLDRVCDIIDENGYMLVNADMTICAQKPKLAPYIEQMRERIADVIGCDISCISVKATTEEHLGFTGEEKGISATAVVLMEKV